MMNYMTMLALDDFPALTELSCNALRAEDLGTTNRTITHIRLSDVVLPHSLLTTVQLIKTAFVCLQTLTISHAYRQIDEDEKAQILQEVANQFRLEFVDYHKRDVIGRFADE